MFTDLFNWLLGAGRELAVVIISMVPLVELRGAVPLGVAIGMPVYEAVSACDPGQYDPDPVSSVFR